MLFQTKDTKSPPVAPDTSVTSTTSDKNKESASSALRTSYALKTKRLSLSAILAAMAMILSYIEALIPMPVPVPGIKLGLANLIVIIAIYKLGFKLRQNIHCRTLIYRSIWSYIFNGRRNSEHNCNVWALQNRDIQHGRHKHGGRCRS